MTAISAVHNDALSVELCVAVQAPAVQACSKLTVLSVSVTAFENEPAEQGLQVLAPAIA